MIESKNDTSKNLEKALQALNQAQQVNGKPQVPTNISFSVR